MCVCVCSNASGTVGATCVGPEEIESELEAINLTFPCFQIWFGGEYIYSLALFLPAQPASLPSLSLSLPASPPRPSSFSIHRYDVESSVVFFLFFFTSQLFLKMISGILNTPAAVIVPSSNE